MKLIDYNPNSRLKDLCIRTYNDDPYLHITLGLMVVLAFIVFTAIYIITSIVWIYLTSFIMTFAVFGTIYALILQTYYHRFKSKDTDKYVEHILRYIYDNNLRTIYVSRNTYRLFSFNYIYTAKAYYSCNIIVDPYLNNYSCSKHKVNTIINSFNDL